MSRRNNPKENPKAHYICKLCDKNIHIKAEKPDMYIKCFECLKQESEDYVDKTK